MQAVSFRPWPEKSNPIVDVKGRHPSKCWDAHLHLGVSRDGGALALPEIQRAMDQYEIERALIFAIDERKPGISFQNTNNKVLKAHSQEKRLIAFARLDPRFGIKAMSELKRCIRLGARGVKLHPRSEKFSPTEAEDIIREAETQKLPIALHTSHENNCQPSLWESIFKRHKRIPFILFHAGKDAYEEAIAVARRNHHLWLETSTLSYFRTSVILKKLGASRVVFGSDLPYSHPALEKLKFDLFLNARDRKRVFLENLKRILGE